MPTAYVALGSNLGDREANLRSALTHLRAANGIRQVQESSFYETLPVGGPPDQGSYLNAAARVETILTPRELLESLLSVERELGRVRLEKWGPRTVDLDLLMYGDLVIDEPGLIVPHPRMHERRFVLEPLAEIAPNLLHPLLKVAIPDLLARTNHESR